MKRQLLYICRTCRATWQKHKHMRDFMYRPGLFMYSFLRLKGGGTRSAMWETEKRAMDLEFDDRFFDAVLCTGAIDSVPDGPLAIREMTKVLKPGGTLILTFTNVFNPYAWWKNYAFYPAIAAWHRLRVRLSHPTMKPGRIRSGPVRALYSRRKAREHVESAGAHVVAMAPYYFNVFLSLLDELMPRAALRMTQRLEEGVWVRPDWLVVGWILKAQKS